MRVKSILFLKVLEGNEQALRMLSLERLKKLEELKKKL